MSEESFKQATQHKHFKEGEEYGIKLGREDGFEQAFVVFLRMLEVELGRTTKIDERVMIRKITENTFALKDIICL